MIKYILARLETRRLEKLYRRYKYYRRRVKMLRRELYRPIPVKNGDILSAIVQAVLEGVVLHFLIAIAQYEYDETQEQLLNYIYEKRLPHFIKVKK